MNTEFLTQLYYKQNLYNGDEELNIVNKAKKDKKRLKEERTVFLRKTNEIKRLKYEVNLKKEAMEEYKENLKMQKSGIDHTISNLKTYRNNLENGFLSNYSNKS